MQNHPLCFPRRFDERDGRIAIGALHVVTVAGNNCLARAMGVLRS
jgi:hypothetical protein